MLFYLCLLAVLLVALQVLALSSFKIPSDSMEPTLLAGDCILVEKCSKGARIFDVVAALNREEVTIRRLPGWRDYRRNDVLVFNFPYPERWDSIGFDVRTYYVKRCIAIPGDTLEIRQAHYRIRGHEGEVGNVRSQQELQEWLESGHAEACGVVMKSYPNREEVDWSIREFGPFYIPERGGVIPMNRLNVRLYANVIEWEQGRRLTVRGDTACLLGDSLIREYRFRENYYFVSGDKLVNSRDSRYWGLLPEPFVVGRVWRIWKSIDKSNGKIRWERIWKRVE